MKSETNPGATICDQKTSSGAPVSAPAEAVAKVGEPASQQLRRALALFNGLSQEEVGWLKGARLHNAIITILEEVPQLQQRTEHAETLRAAAEQSVVNWKREHDALAQQLNQANIALALWSSVFSKYTSWKANGVDRVPVARIIDDYTRCSEGQRRTARLELAGPLAGPHDSEICGCGSDAAWCPYNPNATELKRADLEMRAPASAKATAGEPRPQATDH